jgi:opacity protein-like surface antigen
VSSIQAGLISLLVFVVGLPVPAMAEYSVDVYAGGAITNDTDLKQTSSRSGMTAVQKVNLDAAFLQGARVGYWFESTDWLGVGLDIFNFRAKADSPALASSTNGFSSISSGAGFSLPVVGISLDVVRLRVPLFRSEDFPHGRLQPYVSGGPALFVTLAESVAGLQPLNQDESHVAVGYKAGGGVAFLLSKSAGIFMEYRFSHFKSEMSFKDSTPPPSNETFQTTLNTHQLIVGFSVRFSTFRTESQ